MTPYERTQIRRLRHHRSRGFRMYQCGVDGSDIHPEDLEELDGRLAIRLKHEHRVEAFKQKYHRTVATDSQGVSAAPQISEGAAEGA